MPCCCVASIALVRFEPLHVNRNGPTPSGRGDCQGSMRFRVCSVIDDSLCFRIESSVGDEDIMLVLPQLLAQQVAQPDSGDQLSPGVRRGSHLPDTDRSGPEELLQVTEKCIP